MTTLYAKVFGNGFLPSETVAITFIKDGLKIKSLQASEANEKDPGHGPQTLFDNEGAAWQKAKAKISWDIKPIL